MMDTIGIIGGGTMGAGIAQVAAVHGHPVILLEADDAAGQAAVGRIHRQLAQLVDRQKLTQAQAAAAEARIRLARQPKDLSECDVLIEAIVEDLAVKIRTFAAVKPFVADRTIFASNTSSLSISRLGDALDLPQRVCGMHFFNPAPVMPLVEVIAGRRTDPAVLDRIALLAESWDKTVVRVQDTPGFIVNRVARPYYLEALRLVEEKLASCEGVDLMMKEVGGFKMGPFELMDLVGLDINYAVTCSVYEQSGQPARFKPSQIQARLVELGRLGRKSGIGFYSYRRKIPEISYRLDTEPIALTPRLRRAWLDLAHAGGWAIEAETGYVLARILCALMNEAALAEQEHVASEADIDLAMQLGTSYPRGLLDWAHALGHGRVGEFLQALNDTAPDRRFTPAHRFT